MAKVIGKDKSALRRATCQKCASIIEFEFREVKTFTSYDYGGGSELVAYVPCPTCGNQIQGVKHY